MKMTQALAGRGHSVRLVVPGRPPQGMPGSWDELADHYGLQQRFPVEWLPANPRLRRYDFSLQAVRRARLWDADLLYTRLPQAAACASFLGMGTILEVHDLPQGKMGPPIFRLFLKGKGARRLVVITRALAEDLARLGAPTSPDFTLIAPDGVDLARYAHLPKPEEARKLLAQQGIAIQTGRFTAGYSGHLYPGRGAQLLLDLAEQLPEITFLLMGGEPQDIDRLQAEAGQRSLNNLILCGFVPNAKLPGYQAACDVLLMPYQKTVAASSGGDISRYLSPMKLFEYLACGRAIVSSNLPVLCEVLSPGIAVLLPPDDLNAWKASIKRLQDEPELRSRLAGQARQAASLYTWDRRAELILSGLESTATVSEKNLNSIHD
jgi:glycosyltransferase involved in cell wall biosynthesis